MIVDGHAQTCDQAKNIPGRHGLGLWWPLGSWFDPTLESIRALARALTDGAPSGKPVTTGVWRVADCRPMVEIS
jgi:hypothetical protein